MRLPLFIKDIQVIKKLKMGNILEMVDQQKNSYPLDFAGGMAYIKVYKDY